MTTANALMNIINTVLEAIQEAGPEGIPDGKLYMMLQSILGERWTLQVHTNVIGMLVEAEKITNHGHLLVAKKKLDK